MTFPGPSPPTNSDWRRFEAVLDRFEKAWRSSDPPRIAEFLPAAGDAGRPYVLQELVKIDLEYRWDRGQQIRTEDYLAQFSELGDTVASVLALIDEECRVRGQHGVAPSTAELAQRFPGRIAEILRQVPSAGQATPSITIAGASDPTTSPAAPPPDESTPGASQAPTLNTMAWRKAAFASTITCHTDWPDRLGRYELREQVGRGGFATVFRAWDPELAREVAIKVPRPEVVGGTELHVRVLREARSAAQLHHPAIVPIHEVGDQDGCPFIVYEFIPGPTLARLLKETRPTPQQAAGWVMRIAQALEYAHSYGIIHRDVKPANIMLGRDGEPLVADFGLALHITEGGRLTIEGDILGTPAYMSPEQAKGLGHAADARSDVYSLGVVLYEMLCGRPPFEGSTVSILHKVIHDEPSPPQSVLASVPPDLNTICLKSIAKEPARRYATAGAMAEDLRRFLHREPILARRTGPVGRFTLWCRRNPALAGTIAVALLALLTLGGVSYRRVVQERDRYLAERQTAVAHLYQSLVREVHSVRLARSTGYRSRAWQRLADALALDTPDRDPESLRQEAAACLGDFVGDEPATWTDFSQEKPWAASLAFAPNGKTLALGFRNGLIQLRDTKTGRTATEFRHHTAGVFTLAFSADGRTLASMDDMGFIKIWNLAPAKPSAAGRRDARGAKVDAVAVPAVHSPWSLRRELRGMIGVERDNVVADTCLLSPDGEHLMACSKGEQRVRMWQVATGALEHEFRGTQDEPFVRAALSLDGKMLVGAYRTAAADGFVVWDVASRTVRKSMQVTRQAIVDVAFSGGEGRFLACACTDGTYVFDTVEWNQRTVVKSDDQFFTVAFHPQQPILAVPDSRTGTVRLWDVVGNREVASLEHAGGPHSVAFSPDGRFLASATNLSLRLWNLHGRGEIRRFAAHQGIINETIFSPNGKLLASASRDGTAKLWEVTRGRPLDTIVNPPYANVAGVAFSPDSRRMAVVAWGGSAEVYDVRSPKSPTLAATLLDPGSRKLGELLWDVAFSPDGRYLAIAGANGVWVWRDEQEPATKREAPKFQRFAVPTDQDSISVHFSPDSRRLAWRQRVRGAVGVWNLEASHAEPLTLEVPGSLAFFNDSTHLLHVDGRNETDHGPLLVLTHLASGKSSTLAWQHLPASVSELDFSVAFSLSPDRRWLALNGSRVTLWDLKTRKLLVALPRQTSPIDSMSWSPDRARLAVGLTDGTIGIWNLPEIRRQLATIRLEW